MDVRAIAMDVEVPLVEKTDLIDTLCIVELLSLCRCRFQATTQTSMPKPSCVSCPDVFRGTHLAQPYGHKEELLHELPTLGIHPAV